jgi:hypothetical protein
MINDDEDLRNTKIILIPPFKAFDDDDLPVEVIGLAQQPDDIRFVTIKNREGEVTPVILDRVFTEPYNPSEAA